MPARKQFRAPLTGDPGIIHSKPKPVNLPTDAELDNMSFEALKALALKAGISPALIMGMSICSEHSNMVPLQRTANAKYSMGLDLLYCNACFTWFREKAPLG